MLCFASYIPPLGEMKTRGIFCEKMGVTCALFVQSFHVFWTKPQKGMKRSDKKRIKEGRNFMGVV